MKGEKQLVEKYKQHHYNKTQRNITNVIVIMGLTVCVLGCTLEALTQSTVYSLFSYVAGFLCICITAYLYYVKNHIRNVISLSASIYFCFVYVPVNWFTHAGLMGNTTYIALAMLVIMVHLLNRKQQKILLALYLILLGGLTSHSLVTAAGEVQNLTQYLLAGTTFIIAATVIAYSLLFLLHKYENLYEHFLDNAVKDKLTGVFNRHMLDEVMALGEAQYMSDGADYAVVMLDIDRFKALNDKYGHAAGDVVLQNFAAGIRQSIRITDYVLRYGGDEFLLMLPGATISNVETIFDRIETAIADNPFLQAELTVTFSRGFAYRSHCNDMQQLIAEADKRMYAYKQAG